MNEIENKSKIVAMYARVSTGRQEQEETVQSQIAEVKAKVDSDGNVLAENLIFTDDGWTGSVLARPELDKLRDVVKQHDIDTLYVYDLGRLSRDFTNQLLLLKEFEDNGVKVISLHDVNPENGEQNFLRNIMGAYHDYERIKIAERFRRGKLYKSKRGILVNGHSKYGWRYIKKTQDTEARYELNLEEANTVKLIWKWFGYENLSINEIRRKLYELQIFPRKRKNDYWSKSQIARVLKCESYVTGKIYYNKSEAVRPKNPQKETKYIKVLKSSRRVRPKEDWIVTTEVEPIIGDYLLYKKICKKLSRNKRYAKKNRKHDYLLTTVLYCDCGLPRCGDGQNKGGHFYYRCSERVNKIKREDRKCFEKGVNAQVLDNAVWFELKKLLSSPKLLMKYATEWIDKNPKIQVDDNTDKLSKILTDIKDEGDRYSKAYGQGVIEFERYQSLMNDLKSRKKSIDKQLDEISENQMLNNKGVNITSEDLVAEVIKIIHRMDLKKKKQVIQDIIDRIIVTERRKVEIWINIQLPVLEKETTLKLGYESISRDCWIAKCW